MSEESKRWYRMTRPLFNSGYEDDEFWAYGRDGFREQLASVIGSDVLIYDRRIDVEPRRVRAIVQNATSDTFNGADDRQILCEIGSVRCGQYVKHRGGWWMVTGLVDNNGIYEKAIMWKCRHSIRFLSPVTGKAVEYPVYSENSTQYGTGEEAKTQITVGDDQHLIYIPYNEETILLDNRFRFIMDRNRVDPTVFRITRVDPVSYAAGDENPEDGIIQWAVMETQFNEAADSREEMIADWFSVKPEGSESSGDGRGRIELSDRDGDCRLALGEEKHIDIKMYPADGQDADGAECVLSFDLADGAAQVVSEGPGGVVLRAAGDRRFVGRYVTVTAGCPLWGCEASMKIQIVDW